MLSTACSIFVWIMIQMQRSSNSYKYILFKARLLSLFLYIILFSYFKIKPKCFDKFITFILTKKDNQPLVKK